MILGTAGAVARSVFSIGIFPRTSIRQGHHSRRAPKPKQNHLRGFGDSWGEEIWVHAHRATGQCVYSHTRVLNVSQQRYLL